MRFVLLCDSNYTKGDVVGFINNFPRNHELVTMTSEDLLTKKALPEGVKGILVERATWQKAFSVLRYFGLLPLLETIPLGVVIRGRKQEPLKGRGTCKEVYFSAGASPEEVFSTLDRFCSLPPSLHQYPRGSAKA